jgi:hypothetical protein
MNYQFYGLLFDLLEPMTYYIWGKHATHYTTDAVWFNVKVYLFQKGGWYFIMS